MDAGLALVKDADVFLIFIESYGAIAYERPDMARRWRRASANLDAAIRVDRPRRRLRVRRVADVRRIVVARAHQPDVGRRSARPGDERPADDRAARDDRHQLRTRGASHRGADAGAAAGVAGRRVLRIRRRSTARRASTTAGPSSAGSRSPISSRWRSSTRSKRRQPPRRRCSCSSPRSARTSRSSRRRRISRTGPGCSSSAPTTVRRSCGPTRSNPTGRISAPAT